MTAVVCAGIAATGHADGDWMTRMAEALIGPHGFLRHHCHLVIDREVGYAPLIAVLEKHGIHIHRTPPQCPDANPHIERFMRTIKDECIRRRLIFGINQLRSTIDAYLLWYRHHRPHQGLGGKAPVPIPMPTTGRIVRRMSVGGLLPTYSRAA